MKQSRRYSPEVAKDLERASDYFDYHFERFRSINLSVCSFLVLSQFLERIAFYSVLGSLQIYALNVLDLSNSSSTQVTTGFGAFTNLVSVIGIWHAEALSGHYRAIRLSFLFYISGLGALAVAAFPDLFDRMFIRVVAFCGLFAGVAVGAGLNASNIVVFGAEQFDTMNVDHIRQQGRYFGLVYWMVNFAAIAAFGGVSYIALYPEEGLPYIKDFIGLTEDHGFVAGAAIATGAIVLSAMFFFCGSGRYFKKNADGSVLTIFIGGWRDAGQDDYSMKILGFGALLQFPAVIAGISSYYFPSEELFDIGSLISFGALGTILLGMWLILAFSPRKIRSRDLLTADVYSVLRLAPLFVAMVIFWLSHNQMFTGFISQACQINPDFYGFTIAPPQLIVCSTVVMMIISPVIDSCCCKWMNRIGRVALGLVLSSASLGMAAYVEIIRKDADIIEGEAGLSICGGGRQVSDLEIWWMAPQFAVMGLAEVLAVVSVMDYAFIKAPPMMRSVMMAMFYLSTALGYYLSGLLSQVLSSWLPTDLNNGHLEYKFLAIAAVGIINSSLFLIRTWNFRDEQYSGAGLRQNKENDFRHDDDRYSVTSRYVQSATPTRDSRYSRSIAPSSYYSETEISSYIDGPDDYPVPIPVPVPIPGGQRYSDASSASTSSSLFSEEASRISSVPPSMYSDMDSGVDVDSDEESESEFTATVYESGGNNEAPTSQFEIAGSSVYSEDYADNDDRYTAQSSERFTEESSTYDVDGGSTYSESEYAESTYSESEYADSTTYSESEYAESTYSESEYSESVLSDGTSISDDVYSVGDGTSVSHYSLNDSMASKPSATYDLKY